MNGGDLKMIADHLGHNLNIHTDIYCLQSSLLERTKVAQLLLAIQNGCVPDFRSKLLSESSIEQIPLPIEYCDEWDAAKCAADQGEVQINTSLPEEYADKSDRDSTECPDKSDYDSSEERIIDDNLLDPQGAGEDSSGQSYGSMRNNALLHAWKRAGEKKQPWTTEENKAIWASFKSTITAGKNVGCTEIRAAMAKFARLQLRREISICMKVNNIIKGKQSFVYLDKRK